MKPNSILIPILLGFALVLGISIGSFLNFPVKPISLVESNERETKLRQIIDYINYEYVDQVNTDSLLDLTIEDLLKKLDPHSTRNVFLTFVDQCLQHFALGRKPEAIVNQLGITRHDRIFQMTGA